MKAILEFELPEDSQEFKIACEGKDWKNVVEDLDNWLRTNTKYASDEVPTQYLKGLEDVRDKIREIAFENGVTLN